MENIVNAPQTTPPASSLLVTRSGANCLVDVQNTPVPKMLFSEFWNEGELAVLFGNDGMGKSLLAVQVADAITRGAAVNGFSNECSAQKVLYIDFSTSDRQFSRRYEGYAFNDNFIRVTINPRHWDLRKFGEQLIAAIEAAVQEHEAKMLVIDSLSTLKFFVNEVFLLSHLLRLKDSRNLSILLLAGARKMQPGKPLSLAGLAAHKMLAGVAGSLFAMGETQADGGSRYLIQLKGNEHGEIYHQDNVVVGRNTVTPVTGNLPGFEFMGYGAEKELLAPPLPADGPEAKILEYRSKAPYASLGELAKWTGTNKMKVKRVLERYAHTQRQDNTQSTQLRPLSQGEGWGEDKPEKMDIGPNAKTTAFSIGNPQLKSGSRETFVPPADSRLRGNDDPSHPKTTTPFHPLDSREEETLEESLKTLDAMITSYCTTKPEPETGPQKTLTYSQQLKKRLAQARKQR